MMKRLTIATVAALALAAPGDRAGAQTEGVQWDAGGSDNSWHNAANWTGVDFDTSNSLPAGPNDTVPTASDHVRLTNTGLSALTPVTITSPAAAASLQVGPRIGATNHDGFLDIRSDLTIGGDFQLHHRAGADGFVTHSAGTLTAGTFALAGSTTSGSTGTYALTGTGQVRVTGSFTASGGTGTTFEQDGLATHVDVDGSITSGNTSGGDPWTYVLRAGTLNVDGSVGRSAGDYVFNQLGGSATIALNLRLGTDYRGSPAAPMEWSIAGDATLAVGGTVQLGYRYDNVGSHTGANSNGRFTLDGSRGAGGGDVTVGGAWDQLGVEAVKDPTAIGTLRAIIDAAAVATPANMRLIDVTGNVTFGDGALLLPEFAAGVTPTPGTWTIMEWGGTLADGGLTLDPSADPQWAFDADPASKSLTITYVPEPTSAALLGAAGLLLLGRRRRG